MSPSHPFFTSAIAAIHNFRSTLLYKYISSFQGEHGDLYEGGTRVLTLISGAGQLAGQGQSYTGLFHQVDWVPTILSLAGAPLDWVKGIDGLNHWHAIRTDSTSPRNEVRHCKKVQPWVAKEKERERGERGGGGVRGRERGGGEGRKKQKK